MPSQRLERGGRDREAEDDEEVRAPGRDSGSSAAENGLGLKTGPGLWKINPGRPSSTLIFQCFGIAVWDAKG